MALLLYKCKFSMATISNFLCSGCCMLMQTFPTATTATADFFLPSSIPVQTLPANSADFSMPSSIPLQTFQAATANLTGLKAPTNKQYCQLLSTQLYTNADFSLPSSILMQIFLPSSILMQISLPSSIPMQSSSAQLNNNEDFPSCYC